MSCCHPQRTILSSVHCWTSESERFLCDGFRGTDLLIWFFDLEQQKSKSDLYPIGEKRFWASLRDLRVWWEASGYARELLSFAVRT